MGIVISGRKDGKKFVSMEEYKKQFKEKLKIEPFPGTLNILSDYTRILKKLDGIIINGFVKDGVKYGNVKCFPVKIGKIKAAIIMPEKGDNNYLEIISKYNLREKFLLKDGDEVKIEFLPFVKKRRKYFLECRENDKKGKIRIYYGNPLIDDSLMEGCQEKKGGKVLPSAMVASLLFERDEKESFKKLMKWTKKRYSIMYPPLLIDYGVLKEWQIEIKWNFD